MRAAARWCGRRSRRDRGAVVGGVGVAEQEDEEQCQPGGDGHASCQTRPRPCYRKRGWSFGRRVQGPPTVGRVRDALFSRGCCSLFEHAGAVPQGAFGQPQSHRALDEGHETAARGRGVQDVVDAGVARRRRALVRIRTHQDDVRPQRVCGAVKAADERRGVHRRQPLVDDDGDRLILLGPFQCRAGVREVLELHAGQGVHRCLARGDTPGIAGHG